MNIVCFSGGHSSAMAAIETVRNVGARNTILLNHDISSQVEHPDIKRFKKDISEYVGVDITYANSPDFENNPPLKIALNKKAFQTEAGKALCTYYLKTKPFYDWLEANANKGDHIIYGFDSEERDRIQRRTDIIRAMGYVPEFPLAYGTRSIEKVEDIGIARPATYKLYRHANCIGCLKAGLQHWYCVYCTRNDIFEEAKSAESIIGHSIIKGKYLAEMEPRFKEMRDEKHICPSERMDAPSFWARVDGILPGQESMLPCDCMF